MSFYYLPAEISFDFPVRERSRVPVSRQLSLCNWPPPPKNKQVAAEWILLIEFAVWEWSGKYSAAADFFKQQNYEMLQATDENSQKPEPRTNWEQ